MHAAFDSFRNELVAVGDAFLKIPIPRPRLHRTERTHAAVTFVGAALQQDRVTGRFLRPGKQCADHHEGEEQRKRRVDRTLEKQHPDASRHRQEGQTVEEDLGEVGEDALAVERVVHFGVELSGEEVVAPDHGTERLVVVRLDSDDRTISLSLRAAEGQDAQDNTERDREASKSVSTVHDFPYML